MRIPNLLRQLLLLSSILFTATVFLTAGSSEAVAWGKMGHRIAARMAEDHLTPAAKAAVAALLGPQVRLAGVASWADEQREISGSGVWHYVAVPIRESRYDPRYCPAQGCVVSKIGEFRRMLRDPKTGKAQKQLALRFLVHLVADLHQPLHVGDDNDKGGTQLQVRFFDEGSNLHRVWDSQIMERHTGNENVWLWDLTFIANPKNVAEWSKGSPEEWATESLALAQNAHRLPGSLVWIKPGAKISPEYCRVSLPVIRKQLAKAGVRIAWVLNQAFL